MSLLQATLSDFLFRLSARACTVCDSSTGQQVRAGIFDGHFLRTLGLVSLPFLAIPVAVVLIDLCLRERSVDRGSVTEEDALTLPPLESLGRPGAFN
jgi:hypothetical protein